MTNLNWSKFETLHGDKSINFEYLCRGIIKKNFGSFGQFKALPNQAGVEFDLKLSQTCSLGDSSRWFGWQCKWHELNKDKSLKSSSKVDIKKSLTITMNELPNLTDWVLWTPYSLGKDDQKWLRDLPVTLSKEVNFCKEFKIHVWDSIDIENYLNGEALLLRETYFGDLVITPQNLADIHEISVQPIKLRWLKEIHQTTEVEMHIRQMLGEKDSWQNMLDIGSYLQNTANIIKDSSKECESLENLELFIRSCLKISEIILSFHRLLAIGDLDIIQQQLSERNVLIPGAICSVPRKLRSMNLPIALDATNALDDMRIAIKILDQINEFLGVGIISIIAEAGGGKTQMAAQLSAPQQSGRPAGILLLGRDLHRGQTLDDLVSRIKLNGKSPETIETLLASLDSAAKRSNCRLPLLIDGLNEAENPKDWKDELARLNKTMNKYPNVLVIVTLRTGEHQRDERRFWNIENKNQRQSFIEMSLPDGITQTESNGFGVDVGQAVAKYFNYYKISSSEIEIPLDMFEHPLILRIFCEVTNPNREIEVKIDYYPASLTSLFEKYVFNACNRIVEMNNLGYSYQIDEIMTVIQKLGLDWWENNYLEIDETSFRKRINDDNRVWSDSIINLLTQEGIIFRDPGIKKNTSKLVPVYDLLGGYIIADALLEYYHSDKNFRWMCGKKIIEKFDGKNRHRLFYDIFVSLVALTPRRMFGKQLWKEKHPFQRGALRYSTEIERDNLDSETITALKDLVLNDSQEDQAIMFERLKKTRGVVGYPFNAVFLNEVLTKMKLPARDVGWTEWIRQSQRSNYEDAFLQEITDFEIKWKNPLIKRNESDLLYAIWVKWFLTSTKISLRDSATRALYWFGRGNPEGLFQETIESLNINDPYIPERLLAASYGVAMAIHTTRNSINNESKALSQFAKQLYEKLYIKDALNRTTNVRIRRYASGIIAVTVLNDSTLFTKSELKKSSSPFKKELVKWITPKNQDKMLSSMNSPFRMDFENYTIGGLVTHRMPYDFKNEEYQKVRAHIFNRVMKLGWTNELFGKIDQRISEDDYSWRRSRYGKTDRYGKKYSWIAYNETVGLLHDDFKLDKDYIFYDVDIDPSFPKFPISKFLIEDSFLDDSITDIDTWVKKGDIPNIKPYLQMNSLEKDNDSWVALAGYLKQEDEFQGKQIIFHIKSMFVKKTEEDAILQYLKDIDINRLDVHEFSNIFAGEIPWVSRFEVNEKLTLKFLVKEEMKTVKKILKTYYLNSEYFSNEENLINDLRNIVKDEDDLEKRWKLIEDYFSKLEERDSVIDVKELQSEFAEYEIEIPYNEFSFMNLTKDDQLRNVMVVSKNIAAYFNLLGKPQSFDLFDKESIQATKFIGAEDEIARNRQDILFIRKELLETYLSNNDLSLIWFIHGEREYSYSEIKKRRNSRSERIWEDESFRSIILYKDN